METIAERITKLVEMSGSKKSEFAESIGVTPSYISRLARVRDINPSRLVIDAICKKHGVNKAWLETGEGPIYTPEKRVGGATKEELSSRFSEIINEPIPYRNEIIWYLSNLTPEEWRIIGEKILEMAEIVRQVNETEEENGIVSEQE